MSSEKLGYITSDSEPICGYSMKDKQKNNETQIHRTI